MREAEVDRHPPALFLLEPVGVDAGEGFDHCALAVVDVTCSANDEEGTHVTPHYSPGTERNASTITSSSPGKSVRTSSSSISSAIRPNTGGRWARSACSSPVGGVGEVMATANEGRCASGKEPPPTSATVGRTVTRHVPGTAAATASRSCSARSRSCSAGAPSICKTGRELQAASGSTYCCSVAASAA